MTNRKRLEEAKILSRGASFTPKQEEAIKSLTEQEVDALISAKNKLAEAFPPPTGMVAPIQHHH